MVSWHPQCLLFFFLSILASCCGGALSLAHSPSSIHPSCPALETTALLHFKHSFAVDCVDASSSLSAYPKVKSWKNGQDCCTWDGVKCDGKTGHVIGLDLTSSCLYGTLSPNSTLFSLNHLQELSLAHNHFNFSLVPSEIGQLTYLRSLDLSYSAFSGQVPLEVSKLSRLSLLDLSSEGDPLVDRQLRLKDPSLEKLVRNLSGLTHLDLTSVDISSPVPTILTNFTYLKFLSLHSCNLYGQLPTGIFGLPHVEELDLSENFDLQGFLPEFQPNSHLRAVILDGTSSRGEVPPSIGRLAHLETLSSYHSSFSGSIPSSIGNLTKLTYLNFKRNGLCCDIPSSLANLTKLQGLFLSDLSAVTSAKLHSLLFKLQKLTQLGFNGMNLATEIPSFFANLTRIEWLDLRENQMIGQLPLWLMNLTQLELLFLGKNNLKGPIPQEISQLGNLVALDLAHNDNLHGNFEPFFKLKFLSELMLCGVNLAFPSRATTNRSETKFNYLSLSSCNLVEFPQFLQSQDELQGLNLSLNKIHGLIPQWLVNKTKESLSVLDLTQNLLTGFEHPVKVLPWYYLEVLCLTGNQFQGLLPIPPSSMKIYRVSHNQLVGGIPQQICQATSLNYLDISNNKLDGQIPICISSVLGSSLEVLNLRGNNFHGIIPHTYPKSCKLKMINLSQNQLEGNIPRSLVNCNMLVVLDVGQNRVIDTFPSWIGSLQNLQVLILRHNHFHGRIKCRSKVGSDFQSLRIIDLSHNFYNGDLPSDCLQIWDAMKTADEVRSSTSGTSLEVVVKMRRKRLPGNLFFSESYDFSVIITNKGSDMLYTKILTVFRVVDFSSNNFTGGIPEIIGKLRGLQALNLSNNNLEGRIPSSLCNITDLESLDLSMNMLSGRIPQELTQLTWLEVFNVSHNLLVGPIPQGNQFDAFDNSSFDGNSGLCGSPLSKKCGNTHESSIPPPRATSNVEEESNVINWVIGGLGYVAGFIVGCAIGKYMTDQNHEWFLDTFGRN